MNRRSSLQAVGIRASPEQTAMEETEEAGKEKEEEKEGSGRTSSPAAGVQRKHPGSSKDRQLRERNS